MNLPGQDSHRKIYLFGLALLAAGIPLSRFAMSTAQILLFLNWIIEGDLKAKLSRFWKNKAAVIFSSIFLLHLLGLIHTSDFSYGFKDIRTKIPLALLPLLIASSAPLKRKTWESILMVFVLAVFTGSLTSTYILFNRQVEDVRYIFPFISHIRFALSLCLALAILFHFIVSPQTRINVPKWMCMLLFAWFIAFLYLSGSISGIAIALVLLAFACFRWGLYNKVLSVRVISVSLLCLGLIALSWFSYRVYVNGIERKPIHLKEWPVYTAKGNMYLHDTSSCQQINGHYVWMMVCPPEMKEAWSARSKIPFEGKSNNGLLLKDVLMRYLTSRGLAKDYYGVKALEDNEINHIEQGICDYRDPYSPEIVKRIRESVWEFRTYQSTGDPNNLSLIMRYEYWKASLAIFRENWLIGAGTGDMWLVFKNYYEETGSRLHEEWRNRSHNQFLSVSVGFGLIGLLWFLMALFFPPLHLKEIHKGIFGAFFLIMIVSMLYEDTMESQDGVTFMAFFFSYLLFGREKESG